MRIAFLFSPYPCVPSNLREYHISRQLERRGHSPIWFCSEQSPDMQLFNRYCTVLVKSKYQFPLDAILYPIYLVLVLKRYRIDKVWLSGWYERDIIKLLFLVISLKLGKIIVCYDTVDPIYEYTLAWSLDIGFWELFWLGLILNVVYVCVDLVIVVTEELGELLVSHGVKKNKIRVAYYGTDLDSFYLNPPLSRLRTNLGLEHKFIIGWLGHMSPFKGIEEILVPVVLNLRNSIPNVVFLLGGKGPLKKNLEKLREKHGVSLLILEDLPYELAAEFTSTCDVYIVPTDPQSQFGRSIRPIKLFDALLSGVPLVTTDTYATARLRNEFKSVSLCRFSHDDFISAISMLHSQYSIIKSLAMAERHQAIKYSHQFVALSVVSELEHI